MNMLTMGASRSCQAQLEPELGRLPIPTAPCLQPGNAAAFPAAHFSQIVQENACHPGLRPPKYRPSVEWRGRRRSQPIALTVVLSPTLRRLPIYRAACIPSGRRPGFLSTALLSRGRKRKNPIRRSHPEAHRLMALPRPPENPRHLSSLWMLTPPKPAGGNRQAASIQGWRQHASIFAAAWRADLARPWLLTREFRGAPQTVSIGCRRPVHGPHSALKGTFGSCRFHHPHRCNS